MEVCCGFFGFDAGDAIEEQEEENPFHAPPTHKPKQKHPLGVARHKPAHHRKKHHRVIPKHHHAARASTVAKGNGVRDHCALPKPAGVAWDGLTSMMPITDPQWEKDFMERLDRIEASDLLRPSSSDGSTVLMFACEHRDALAVRHAEAEELALRRLHAAQHLRERERQHDALAGLPHLHERLERKVRGLAAEERRDGVVGHRWAR